MDRILKSVIIRWEAVEQYFTVVLFVFQFYLVCNFGKFVNFGLGVLLGVKKFKYNNTLSNTISIQHRFVFLKVGLYLACHNTSKIQLRSNKKLRYAHKRTTIFIL